MDAVAVLDLVIWLLDEIDLCVDDFLVVAVRRRSVDLVVPDDKHAIHTRHS
jgi:hypothetical protein